MSGEFSGQRVLLTGGLGSLGRAQAQMFVAAGADLLLLDRPDDPRASAAIAEIGAQGPGTVSWIGQDLSDLAGTQAKLGQICEAAGGVDVLINNAALIVNKPFEAFSLDEYEAQMRVNVGAAFALSQVVAPAMKRKGRGAIINFASVTLSGDWSGYAPYVASKGAMVGLTRSLARELGPHGVRVNALSPGAVVSEAEERVFGDRAAAYEAWVLGRQCLPGRIQPADIAQAVLFLAGEGARMISGHTLEVDAGW